MGTGHRIDRLTRQQLRVAILIARGCSNADIARRLSISVQTVKNHVSAIYARLGIRNRVALAVLVHAAEPRRARGP